MEEVSYSLKEEGHSEPLVEAEQRYSSDIDFVVLELILKEVEVLVEEDLHASDPSEEEVAVVPSQLYGLLRSASAAAAVVVATATADSAVFVADEFAVAVVAFEAVVDTEQLQHEAAEEFDFDTSIVVDVVVAEEEVAHHTPHEETADALVVDNLQLEHPPCCEDPVNKQVQVVVAVETRCCSKTHQELHTAAAVEEQGYCPGPSWLFHHILAAAAADPRYHYLEMTLCVSRSRRQRCQRSPSFLLLLHSVAITILERERERWIKDNSRNDFFFCFEY